MGDRKKPKGFDAQSPIRRSAAFALACLSSGARLLNPPTIHALIRAATTDPCPYVRRDVCEALGWALQVCLIDDSKEGERERGEGERPEGESLEERERAGENEYAVVGGLGLQALGQCVRHEHEEVRMAATHAVSRLINAATEGSKERIRGALAQPLVDVLEDENRYVSAWSYIALARLDSADALDTRHTVNARWCSHTNVNSPF